MSGFGHDTEMLVLTVQLRDGEYVEVFGENDGVNGYEWSARHTIDKNHAVKLPVEVDHDVLIDGITPVDEDLPFHDPTCCHDDCEVTATVAGGEHIALFGYYIDELSFSTAELVGLTVSEARALRHNRDVAYLQS